MFKMILVASGKGGSGKTSFCAGVGYALAYTKKVLLIDADSKLRNLDIALGLTERAIFSFEDVAKKVVTLDKACVQHPECPNLHLLTAPYSLLDDSFELCDVEFIIEEAKKLNFDYVFVDCPAGITREIKLFSQVSNQGVVVSTPDLAALRGAEFIAREMESNGIVRMRIVMNRVRLNLVKSGNASNIDDAMDMTGLALLGIIPEDEDVITCGNKGISIHRHKKTQAALAYVNISKRLEGSRMPLMKI